LTAGSASKLRLFLSVDIAGSTALKDLVNYQSLTDRVRYTKKVLQELRVEDRFASLVEGEVLAPKEEVDWATILRNRFGEFHAMFGGEIKSLTQAAERYPWKSLGDELVYSFNIQSRDLAASLVTSFLRTLRLWDRKLGDKNLIRMKGTAWTAGFPIRNREVELPMPEVFFKEGEAQVSFPYPRLDFWGPDMDVGFRLGAASFHGMCAASMDLVDLLSNHQSNQQIRAVHVGWERLKGVWGGRPYPIFWLELPEGQKGAEEAEALVRPWAVEECGLLGPWLKNPKREAKDFRILLGDIRKHLPEQFGVVAPYIVSEDEVPKEHQELLNLLKSSSKLDSDLPPHSETEKHDAKASLESALGKLQGAESNPAPTDVISAEKE
jgi:hypothetical protein